MEKLTKLTLSVEDFLVSHSALLEKDEDFLIKEGQCFLKLYDLQRYSNLSIYSLRTSKGYSITKTGRLSKLSSLRWTNWGMMCNGKCLTAKILTSPKIENECTLLDILEENVPDKYFLSNEKTKQILPNSKK